MSLRMHRIEDGAAHAGPQAGDVAALLQWWALSGADTLTGDAPASWLSAPEAMITREMASGELADAPHRQNRVSAIQRPAAAPIPAGADMFADVKSLADLHAMVKSRHPNAPFADGNPASGIMILGEAPSAEDLRTGRPFTGPAGLLLDRMLAAIGLDRAGCYIALLAPLRRVPGPPPPDAIASDLPLARAHIRLAAPRNLLLLGAAASQTMTGNTTSIGKLRGSWLQVDAGNGPVPALATFNPAYLLRRPEDKALAWADLLAFRQRLLQ